MAPMVLRLMPSVRSQAGTRFSSRYSGSPELKPVKMHVSIRRVNRVAHRDGRSLMRARVPQPETGLAPATWSSR